MEVARVAAQAICKCLCNHEFYLNIHAVIGTSSNNNTLQPELKRSRQPLTKNDCKGYTYVLLSVRTVSDYKHLQACQAEYDSAVALANKTNNLKVTSDYDTTLHDSIDGGQVLFWTFRMAKRPLFFAYEDRSQITNLTVETYELTPAAATEFLKKQIDASDLWEDWCTYVRHSS